MEFVNRNVDRQKLTELLIEEHTENHVIVLQGYTGVGKTGLIEYLFSNTVNSRKCLQIHVSKTSVGTIENGSYFSALYNQLAAYSEEKRTIISPFEYGITSFRNLFGIALNLFKNLIHLNENDKIYEPTDDISIIRKRDYILNVLKSGSFIIDFENIQNIDTQSMEWINNIIQKTAGNTYIFEYTLSEDIESFNNFCSELMHYNLKPQCYYLQEIDFEEALKLLSKPIEDPDKLSNLKEIYENSHGNLMNIKLYDSKQIIDSTDIIDKVLSKLSKNEMYIIYIIYLNGGSIENNILMRLITKHNQMNRPNLSYSQYITHLEHLKKLELLKVKGFHIQLQNSVIARMDSHRNFAVLYNAYAVLKDYYMDMHFNHVNPELWIYKLFSLYITFSDPQIVQILPSVRQVLLECKYPQNILERLELFKDKLIENNSGSFDILYSVCSLLTEVCIEIEDLENAKKFFEQIPTLNKEFSYHLLEAKIYALNSKEEAMLPLQDLENQYPINSSERLLIEICRLRFMLRACSQDKSAEFADILLQNSVYQKLPEYAFLLMNAAEVASSPQTAISMYEEAGRMFAQNKSLEKYSPLTKINLAMSNGYLGRLEDAKKNLDEAELSPLNRTSYICNNRAVLDLLKNTCTEQTISNLEDSLLLTSNIFEQLIIKNNLLIANLLHNNKKQAQDLCCELEASSYENYRYGEFLQMNYQNLLFYHRLIGNSKQIEFYEQKIDQLAQSSTTAEGTKHLAILMKNGQKENGIFYSSFPYRAEFLCYWGIPSQYYSLASEHKN